MLEAAELPAVLQKNGHKRFNKGHPEVKAVNTHHINIDSVNLCTSEEIRALFERLRPRKYNINDAHVYNADESSLQMSEPGREGIL